MIKRILAGAAGLFRRTFEVTQLCHRVERSVCHQSSINLDQKIEDSFIISREEFRHTFRD